MKAGTIMTHVDASHVGPANIIYWRSALFIRHAFSRVIELLPDKKIASLRWQSMAGC